MTIKEAYDIIKVDHRKEKLVECLEFDDFFAFFSLTKMLVMTRNMLVHTVQFKKRTGNRQHLILPQILMPTLRPNGLMLKNYAKMNQSNKIR